MSIDKRFPAFTDEQMTLLRSLLKASQDLDKSEPEKKDRTLKKTRQASARAIRSNDTRAATTGAPARQSAAFAWIPKLQNDWEDYRDRGKLPATPSERELVHIGEISFSSIGAEGRQGLLRTPLRTFNVRINKVTPAIVYAFKEFRLAWIKHHSGIWTAVKLRIIRPRSDEKPWLFHWVDLDPALGAHQQLLANGPATVVRLKSATPQLQTSPPKRATQNGDRTKKPYKKPDLRGPDHEAARKTAAASKQSKKLENRRRAQLTQLERRSAVVRDSSSLVPSSGRSLGSIGSSDARRGAAVSLRSKILLSVDSCVRCQGMLFDCPLCDGSGFIKRYEGDPQPPDSAIALDYISATPLSGRFGLRGASPGPALTPDHESIHRADSNDGGRHESTGIQDSGRMGSMPLYDDYDQ